MLTDQEEKLIESGHKDTIESFQADEPDIPSPQKRQSKSSAIFSLSYWNQDSITFLPKLDQMDYYEANLTRFTAEKVIK